MSGYYRNIIYLWLAALVVCAGMSSCGSKRASSAKTPYRNAKTEHIRISANLPPSVKALMTEADSWIGTRYAYGGMDRSGVDCSGFVHQVYKNALDIKLPRNSAKQQEYCNAIHRRELQIGDLVFFTVRGGSKVGHVGIYIGDDKMIHASTSSGVIITHLDNPYFKSNYFSSGRINQYYSMIQRERKRQSPSESQRTIEQPQQPSEILQAAAHRVTQPKGSVRIAKTTPPPATQAAMARASASATATAPATTSQAPSVTSTMEIDEDPSTNLTVIPDFFD